MKTNAWVSFACAVSVILGTTPAPLAFARNLTPSNFSALPNATLDIAGAKLFCTRYFVTNNPYTSNLFSSSPSQSTGDQWCAEHGVVNGPNYAPTPSTTATPTASSGQGTCQTATLSPADTNAGLSCSSVTDGIESCNLHGTQLQTQCEALLAAVGGSCGDSGLQGGGVSSTATADGNGNCSASKGATAWDQLLEAADIAVAGVCGYVCAEEASTAGVGAVVEEVCSNGAMATGASDLLLNRIMKQNGPVSGFIQQWGGLGGVAAGVGMGENGASTMQKRNLACGSAVLFAMMASARHDSIQKTWNVAQSYVDSINKLISSALAVNGSSGGSTNPMYGTIYHQGGVGGTSGGASGGSNTVTGTSYAQVQRCLASGGLGTCAAQAGYNTTQGAMSAPDANLLGSLGPNLGQLLKGTNLAALATKASQPGGVPGTLASMMPGGAMGQGIVAASKIAADHPKELASLGISTPSYTGGGGGRALASTKSDNPFASLMGGGATGPVAMSGSTAFATTPKIGDIWHTGTSENLFEIVSHKIETVSNRLH